MELVKIQIGTSLFYYIYILVCAGVFAGLYFGLRHKSDKIQKRVLFGFLAFNFVLHFLKLVFPQYISKEFPAIVRKCSFENICAVSTMIFPFIFISKWKTGKDYMFYLGAISGVVGCLSPLPAKGLEFYQLETMRYYFCHATIWQVPVLMVVFGLHKLDYRRNWKTLAMYFGVLCIILVNELILIRAGWVETPTFEEFFDPTDRDMGYAVGFPPQMQGIADALLFLTPKAWRNPCIPILWEFFPVVILGGIYTILMCAYWEHEHIKQDILTLIEKIKAVIEKIKAFKAKRKEKKEQAQNTDESEE